MSILNELNIFARPSLVKLVAVSIVLMIGFGYVSQSQFDFGQVMHNLSNRYRLPEYANEPFPYADPSWPDDVLGIHIWIGMFNEGMDFCEHSDFTSKNLQQQKTFPKPPLGWERPGCQKPQGALK